MFHLKNTDDAIDFIDQKMIPAFIVAQVAQLADTIQQMRAGIETADVLRILQHELPRAVARLESEGIARCSTAVSDLMLDVSDESQGGQ